MNVSSTVTKSVRFTRAEAEMLNNAAQLTAINESALMKKWILEGIQTQKLILAVQAYMERETDLRGGAAMAGVSYNRFLNELQKRNIVVLEDDYFLDRLAELADAFNNETLRQAVEQIASGLN